MTSLLQQKACTAGVFSQNVRSASMTKGRTEGKTKLRYGGDRIAFGQALFSRFSGGTRSAPHHSPQTPRTSVGEQRCIADVGTVFCSTNLSGQACPARRAITASSAWSPAPTGRVLISHVQCRSWAADAWNHILLAVSYEVSFGLLTRQRPIHYRFAELRSPRKRPDPFHRPDNPLLLVPARAEQQPVVAYHSRVLLFALARLRVQYDVVDPAALLGSP